VVDIGPGIEAGLASTLPERLMHLGVMSEQAMNGLSPKAGGPSTQQPARLNAYERDSYSADWACERLLFRPASSLRTSKSDG
jgi:hypothetical protein